MSNQLSHYLLQWNDLYIKLPVEGYHSFQQWVSHKDFSVSLREIYSERWASSGGLVGKNTPAMQEMRVQSLGQRAPVQKEMAAHSSMLT